MDETLVDVGGHDNEIFLDLSKRERLEYKCSICRLILNQPQQCCNGHLYCLSCIKEWTKRGNKTCPTCGVHASYSDNTDLRNIIESKYVRCESSMCAWKGRLERLKHHVADSHPSSESSVSTERDSLSTDDLIEYHKVVNEVNKIHHLKKEVVQRRIKKMEKIKRQNVLDRQSAQTLPPLTCLESNTSRSDYYRPLTDINDRKTDRLPAIALQHEYHNRGSFYQRLEDIENVKQKKREITRKKLEQIESRKVAERHSLYRKIQDIEQKQQENRYNSEQRILQIERKIREEKDAFQRKLSAKERKNKDGHLTWQRHKSVIKVRMKNDKMTTHHMKSTIKP